MSIADHSYLIIGGSPRSGTTSLFKWLSDHPSICAASIKETRFFLDADYPLQGSSRFNGDNLDDYRSFYRHCREQCGQVRLEATPDYLYTKVALQIATLLPKAKMVFVARDPVERLVSWYKYSRQRRLIDSSMSFYEYVIKQVEQESTIGTPVHMRALDQCRYDKYVPAFRQAFGERVLTINFSDIKDDALTTIVKLCDFIGVDGSYFGNHRFTIENASLKGRESWLGHFYSSLRRRVAYSLRRYPLTVNAMRVPNRIVKSLILKDATHAGEIIVSSEIKRIIQSNT